MVADTLSRLSIGSVSYLEDYGKRKLAKKVHWLARLGVKLNATGNNGVMVLNSSQID